MWNFGHVSRFLQQNTKTIFKCRYNWMPKKRHLNPASSISRKKPIIFLQDIITFSQPRTSTFSFKKSLFYFGLQRKLSENLSKFKSFWSCETPLTNFYMHRQTQTHSHILEKSRVEIQIKVFFHGIIFLQSVCMVIKMASGLRGWWRRGYFAYNLLALSNIVQTAIRQTTCF